MAPSIPDATAPFNFIPYEPKTVLDDWEDEPGRWSGTIKCSLTALSPLLVANVHTRREDGSTDCEFMKIDGTPVIPGSSIKGMLRSLAEILSFSKLAPVSRDPIFYRNVTDNKVYLPGFAERLPGFEESVMGGFLRRDGVDYWLIPVAVDPVPGNSSMEKDHKNYLRTGANFTGYVTTGGFPEGCHKTAYKFPKPGPSANKIKLRREVYDNFEAQLTESQRKRWNKERLTGPGFGHPVFYRVENGEIAEIGLARFFRRKYRNAAADLTGDADGAKDFCSRLFGRVGKNRDGKTETRKGKAAVGPAFVEGKEMTPREVIAGSPKITCLPCYLRQGKNNVKPLPKATDKYDIGAAANYNEQSALRGRKMYWHQRQLATPKIEEPEKKRKVISILHPLARDARAEFEIRVTNLTDLELGCLLEAIDLEDGLAHKIGMGKPFGFGSVRLKIVELDIEDTTERYKSVYKRLFEPPVKLEAEEVGADARVKFRETVMAKVRKKFPEWGKYKSWEELPPIAALRLMLDEKGPKADEIKYMDLDQFAIHAPLPEPEKILRRAPQPAPAKAPRKQK